MHLRSFAIKSIIFKYNRYLRILITVIKNIDNNFNLNQQFFFFVYEC